MTQKDTEFQDGSLTELEIIEKVKISKLLLTFLKQNSEKMLKDYIRLKPIEVLDIDGDLELEVNILKPPVVEVQQSESKEKRNDYSSQKKYYKQSVIFKEYYYNCNIVYTLIFSFPCLNSQIL
jgi:hypothetical protein